jgi:hypothetical protein
VESGQIAPTLAPGRCPTTTALARADLLLRNAGVCAGARPIFRLRSAKAEARFACKEPELLQYRLFSHDGYGNFSLIQEFTAPNDIDAAEVIGRWRVRPLELWQSSRKVKCWA